MRRRIVPAVLLAAVLPVAIVAYLALDALRGRTEEQHARQLEAVVEAARRRVDDRIAHDRRAVDRLCEPDFVVDRLLLDLAADRFGPSRQDDLVQQLPAVRDSLGLDALELLDARAGDRAGRVLASAHYPGRAGATDRELVEAARSAGAEPFVREIRLRRAGDAHDARALLTACVAERDDVRILVVGGRTLDEGFARDLASDVESVNVRLTGAGGEPPPDVPTGGGTEDVRVFRDAQGQPAARLVAAIDDRAVREQLSELQRQFWIGGGLALGIAILIGVLISWWATRPLRSLEDAARRVGAGDLESTIGVREGGEVGDALEAFNQMTRELKRTREKLLRAERIAAWRDIARRIAHEIKNPLSPIQVSIETMRKTYRKKHPDFDEIFEESTLTILEEVERLKRIVTEFSRFARLPRPHPEQVAIEDVVSHVAGLHQGTGVHVEVETDPDLPSIRADREQITQVLVNLVQNAADAAAAVHGDHGGHVRIAVEHAPEVEGVLVRIQDDGPGVPPEDRLRIFEPYYTTKPEGKGTGLGLAIVHRIVGDHGGSIEVGESPQGGAEMAVLLTAKGPPPEAEASLTDAAVPLVQKR